MNIKANYLVGKISGNDWSGIYGYRPDEGAEIESELFCVVRLKSDAENVELERIAKMLLDEFQDAYYNDLVEEDEIVKLEEALQKMKTKLEVIVSREDEILEKGMDIEMSIALVNKDLLTVGVIGDSKLFIYRNQKLVDISKGLVDANMMGFVKTGSLKLESSDRILLTTSTPYTSSLSKLEELAKYLQVDLLGDISEDKGSAILIFADESENWNSFAPVPQAPIIDVDNTTEVIDSQVPIGEFIEDTPNDFNEDTFTNSNDLQSSTQLNPTGEQTESIPYDNEWANDGRENDIDLVEESTTTVGLVNKFGNRFKNVSQKVSGLASKLPTYKNKAQVGPEFTEFEDDQSNEYQDSKSTNNGLNNSYVQNPNANSNTFESVKNTAATLKENFAFKKGEGSTGQKTYQQVAKTLFQKIKILFGKFLQFLKNDVIGLDRLDRRKNADKLKRNRVIMVIVLIILVGLIYFAWKDADNSRRESERIQNVTSKVSQLESEVNQAVSQVETVKNQDQTKKDILSNKLTTLATSIDTQKKENLFTDELDRLKVKINLAKDSLSFIKEINESNIQLVTDVGKLFSDTNLSDLAIANGSLYATDAKRNVVYKINTGVNSTAQELIKNLNTPAHLVRNAANNLVVYDSDTSSSMGILNTQSGEFTRLAGLSTALIGNISEAAIYSNNDALYELHQNHQQIFKRDKVGNSYGGGGSIYVTINPPNWKTDAEFARAIDISVPYEIYVLIEGTGIKRYLAGGDNSLNYETYQNFAQTDFNSLSQATAIDLDQNYMAVADPKNKRVMVFEVIDNEQKNVKFIQQFVYRGTENIFSNIKEVVVDQSTNTVYVLDGSKIIKVSL